MAEPKNTSINGRRFQLGALVTLFLAAIAGAVAIGSDMHQLAEHERRLTTQERYMEETRDMWAEVRERLARIEARQSQ